MKKILSVIILVLTIIGITIGYATLNSNLNISGTSTINNATWDIHFENIQTKSGSVTPTSAATINGSGNTVSYAVSFSLPGEFYEFTVDVKNSGTIDGMVESITSTINGQPISNLPNYLEYYITYEDGIEIDSNHLLAAGSKETYIVHIGFKKDIDSSDLPSSNQTLNVIFGINYVQSDANAVERPVPRYIYAFSTRASVRLNEPLPSIFEYNDYNSVISYHGFNFFQRILLYGDMVKEISLGFVFNNNVYYLLGSGDGSTYSSNKELMKNVFGSSYCWERGPGQYVNGTLNNTSYTYYYCIKDGLTTHIRTDGYMRLYSSGGECGFYTNVIPGTTCNDDP